MKSRYELFVRRCVVVYADIRQTHATLVPQRTRAHESEVDVL